MTMPETTQSDLVERRFLLVKRGLYYGPDNHGYTGFKDKAGRYLESDAYEGVQAIHEDQAEEFAPECFEDLKVKHLMEQRNEAREESSRLRAHCEAMAKALETAERQISAAFGIIHPGDKDLLEGSLESIRQPLAAYRKEGGA